jgi:hypothetical protein
LRLASLLRLFVSYPLSIVAVLLLPASPGRYVDLALGEKNWRVSDDSAHTEPVMFVTVNRIAKALNVDPDVLVRFDP